MASQNYTSTGLGNGMLLDGMKPLSKYVQDANHWNVLETTHQNYSRISKKPNS